jgi:hypothetical protein
MDQVLSYFDGENDMIKYAYENAGKSVSNGTNSVYMHDYFRRAVDIIRKAEGSNMIPTLSLDTINLSASDNVAVELLCQYCVRNGYSITSLENARRLATSFSPDTKYNYFPNPTFKQKLLNAFGGASTSIYAHLPEGMGFNGEPSVSPENFNITVDPQDHHALKLSNASGGGVSLETYIYGLPSGNYSFSMSGKAINGSGISVRVYALKNSNSYMIYPTWASTPQIQPVYQKTFTESEYETVTAEIIIPEKTYSAYNVEDYKDAVTKGYGDNIACLFFLITVPNGVAGAIHSPSIKPM